MEERRRLVRAGALYGSFGGVAGGNNHTGGDGALIEVGVDLRKKIIGIRRFMFGLLEYKLVV